MNTTPTRQRAPGGGRKPAAYTMPAERLEYEAARARNEAAKARLNELELARLRGDYVLRADVQQATATAWATAAQSLRSIPDNLERRMGLAPEVAGQIADAIDNALDAVANKFEEMARQAQGDIDAHTQQHND